MPRAETERDARWSKDKQVNVQRSATVDIIGRACRLPGAAGCDGLWRVLAEGRCTVGEIGDDRWLKAHYFNPRQGERGKSYTFAAGVLDDVWGFDPGVFGLSPREAENMDPQQRVLLQVVWEALEDAGIPPSRLAGADVGVYVGVSSPDTATRRSHDVGATDAYTMTGSTLSLVSNRISYVFDWHGPSFSVDTACSSALVALSQALDAVKSGRIDTAVVGGVNMLLSPFPFLGFAAARMLAPDGRCRPFDAKGQGYVRAEGAVALVLRRREAPEIGCGRRYAEVVAAGVNSDGKTSGISLPSMDSQAALLEAIYSRAGIDPNQLAFVEAHGTGTRVGDPAEAGAIGRVLGQKRKRPLPIGSIKSNIGHLEPAAGLAGLLKALLAFEHGVLPASLHFETPNPAIPFAKLKLQVAAEPVELDMAKPCLAGVSAFGFGGTNAHVVLRSLVSKSDGRATSDRRPAHSAPRRAESGGAGLLMLAAQCRDGLLAQARAYRPLVAGGKDDTPELGSSLASTYAVQRELMPERLVVTGHSPNELASAIDAFLSGAQSPSMLTGRAVGRGAKVAFVYTGNGSQWAGMGRIAYERNRIFRERLDALSVKFTEIAGWSLSEKLFSESLDKEIAEASVAQPLLFGIQAALTDALAAQGLRPDVVLGHSVGEIAAAYAGGAINETQALHVIAARSSSQELARGTGTMAALALSEDEARDLVKECKTPSVEIGAINSPKSVTLSGPREEIEHCAAIASARGHRVKVLDLQYPFHSALVEVARSPLLEELDGLTPRKGEIAFVSTVSGGELAGTKLDASYWWQNVRMPVRFASAIDAAFDLGARVFVEISPRAILQGYLAECLGDRMQQAALVPSLGNKDNPGEDPVRLTTARALSRGARIDSERAFGTPILGARLPLYPWQNKQYDVIRSPEATSMLITGSGEHRYLGWQERDGVAEWFSHLDIDLFPELGDHRIGGQVYVPGAVLAEMALAAATRWQAGATTEVYDLDILAPLILQPDSMREVRTRIEPGSRSLQIASRRRLSDEDWQVHVEARFGIRDALASAGEQDLRLPRTEPFDAAEFYARAKRLGLDYGPRFQRLVAVCEGDDTLHVDIAPAPGPHINGLLLDPIALDVAFHGLLHKLLTETGPSGQGYVPIRFGHICVERPGHAVNAARVRLNRSGMTTVRCDVHLLDAEGSVVAIVQDARFKSSTFVRHRTMTELIYRIVAEPVSLPGSTPSLALPLLDDVVSEIEARLQPSPAEEEAFLLLEAAARRVGLDIVLSLTSEDRLSPRDLAAQGRIPSDAIGLVDGLLQRLQAADLASPNGRDWRVERAAHLPPLDSIIQTVLAEHHRWWPDCAVLATASAAWREALQPSAEMPSTPPYASSLLEALACASPRAGWHIHAVSEIVHEVVERTGSAARPVRILQLGCGYVTLTRALVHGLEDHNIRLVVVDGDQRAIERMRTFAAESSAVSATSLEDFTKSIADHGRFDLIIAADALQQFDRLTDLFGLLAQTGSGDAPLIATCSEPDAFQFLVYGLFDAAAGRATGSDELERLLRESRCSDIVARRTTLGSVVLAHLPSAPPLREAETQPAQIRSIFALDSGSRSPLFAAIDDYFRSDGRTLDKLPDDDLEPGALAPRVAASGALDLLWLLQTPKKRIRSADEELAAILVKFTSLVRSLDGSNVRLWLVAEGSLRDHIGLGPSDPVMAGVAAFARTAANEHANIDLRVVDAAASLSIESTAVRFAALLAAPVRETELVLTEQGAQALRVVRGSQQTRTTPAGAEAAARLDLSHDPGSDRLLWRQVDRRDPRPGEVEIEIAATGLNFRDCMWSMGLLPEEALEDGFAGPTLGFECSGTVVRTGSDVTDLAPGKKVIAFAPAAFASHVTVSANAVARVPDSMELEAAATVPVPFITAYYALEHLGRLQSGESVLIHGGAGGVGLAALQIAKWRGAVVFATAGSRDKRELLALLGADHVLDSRSLAFADDIMRITDGKGVDVVLNSLAGEAMERSLALVKPFGRFLELGKRDFYGSTKIGLRPFRRNVSYYGIDADQLLAQKPEQSRRIFAELAEQLDAGTFVPLPYRKFDARAVGDAFRLMQQSGHIGKIIVTPPVPERIAPDLPFHAFAADPTGVHVIFGGLGGFGLATARWLVDHGARRIVLASRTGKPAEADARDLAALKESPAEITVEACDVTSEKSIQALLARARKSGPVRGVIHAAMVLDDDFIARLTPARIQKVLTPKVAGADLLDRLTRADDLQYFVLYSSVTVLIGNPGQATYVAANGYLEAVARKRRAAGLPALAVGWGGITDAGYLARNTEVGKAIERRTGTTVFTASEALDTLGALLVRGDEAPASITIAPMSWASSRDHLPLLAKPLFSRVMAAEGSRSTRSESVDIASQIAELPDTEARDLVCRRLGEEVARIFRMPAADVSPSRSLAELGMDSLMGLELRVAVQQRLGADIPLSAMAGNQTLSEIAGRIVSSLRAGKEAAPQVSRLDADLAQQHVADGIEAEKLAPLLREIDRRDTRIGAR